MTENLTKKKFKEKDSFQPIPQNASSKGILSNTKKFGYKLTRQTLNVQTIKKRNFEIIGFLDESLSERVLQNLKSALKQSKKVRKIELSFARFLGVKRLNNTMKSFKGVISLQSIYFNFSENCYILNNPTGCIRKCIKKSRFLKEIVLNFNSCVHLRDAAFQNLSKCLKACALLQKVELHLSWCLEITTIGFYLLSKSLKRLTSLHNASFDFSSCYCITDERLQFLVMNLKGLVNLECLSLFFHYCDLITDKGLYGLCEIVLKLPCLQKISLSFKGCREISLQGEEKIKEMFMKHPSFLKFGKCPRFRLNVEFKRRKFRE